MLARTFSGKKPFWVMKLPWRCRKHLGGSENMGLAAVLKALLTTALRPPKTLPSARASFSNSSAACTTTGSLKGISCLTHWSYFSGPP